MRLSEHVYRTVKRVSGPLLFVERVAEARSGEAVRIVPPEGPALEGEVLEIDGDTVLVEVFGETRGLDIEKSQVAFTDSVKKAPLSRLVLGRVFNGSFTPIDGLPMYVAEKWAPITGSAINPTARARAEEFVETGISVIDGLNTLVKGQKLPVFSGSGLPSKEVVAALLRHSRLRGPRHAMVVVFAGLGLTFRDYSFYRSVLDGMATNYVAFINLASDPVIERLLAPRFALTVAEYLAFEHAMDALVIVADIVNYADALREVSTARGELPGRRGYPGYMYSDLATLYERAGRVKGREGSVTMVPVVTMPEDDITHPIPDLTGYITEGQIVLSRELHQKGVFPPVDVLPSLSRLMQSGIGEGRTRADHKKIAGRLYSLYARGRDLRKLEAIIGREGMTPEDRKMLDFAEAFETEFVHQGGARRTIDETLDNALGLLERFGLK
ncbi:MAG: ATP synthase subunit B [Thermodesulfovibrionales bacterium]